MNKVYLGLKREGFNCPNCNSVNTFISLDENLNLKLFCRECEKQKLILADQKGRYYFEKKD